MPLISIITTTYKHEKFIAETIDSILNQSFTDWELLIGDDNSPDQTYEIAQSYADRDSRIRVWKHSKNLGIVGNMNALISQISPESQFVTFLEGDDCYTPDNLEKKMEVFTKYPQIDFLYSGYILIDAESRLIARQTRVQKEGVQKWLLPEFLSLGNPIQSFGVVALRKSLLETINPISTPSGDQHGMYGPLDYWLWTRLVPDREVYILETPIFQYRLHGANFVRNVSVMNAQIQEIYEYFLKTFQSHAEIQRICYFFIENNSMMTAFFDHDRRKVWYFGLRSFRFEKYHFSSMRIAVLFVSLLPWSVVDWLYHKYRG